MSIKKFLISISILILIFWSSLVGFWYGKSQCTYCKPEEIDFSLFWEAYHKLREKFVDKEKFDVQKMIYGAISGMVKSLNDPYTTFLNPTETERFMEDVKGTFGGVGIEIDIKKGQLTVVAPLENTPAERADLRPGDKILKINDTPTAGITIDEAVNLIRGQKGTEVTLTISREGWEEPKEIKLVREIIEIPSLKWEIKEGEIAYIKIYQFSEKITPDFQKASLEILSSPAKKIILDLRNNPGGLLSGAVDVAGWFLKRGEVVLIEDYGLKNEQRDYKSLGPSRFSEYPTVVLINGGSASGAEILAGALRDSRGILLIGEKSFGKGLVQEPVELKGGSSLKITVAKWLTPKGQSISEVGLEPDIKVEMTEEDYKKDLDPQLDKAIEIIKNL
jgi:carboxyl-terminal processing protease